MNNLLFSIMIFAHKAVRGIANRLLDKKQIRPRNFSNAILRKYAAFFVGSIINVSGWKDGDGEGGVYKEYFINATDYSISNVGGQHKGLGAAPTGYREYEIDLLKDLPKELERKFDVVFNHTTLEHVYDFTKAFNNLCALSKDVVILVVPVMQQIHHTEDFGDYWRPTTMVLARLFKDNGLEPLVIACNEQPFAPIYCFAIASRNPEKYANLFPERINFQMGAYNYGSSLNSKWVEAIVNRS